MSKKNRIIIYSSLIMSIIHYSMVLLINVNAKQIDILSVLVNKIARHCIGYHSYWWTDIKLRKTCNWMNAVHLTVYAILNIIHKVNHDIIPRSLVNLFKYSGKQGRHIRTPHTLKYIPRSQGIKILRCIRNYCYIIE